MTQQAIVAFAVRDLNLNIDFEGGTSWQVTVPTGDASSGSVRDVVEGAGVSDPTVKILGGGDQALVLELAIGLQDGVRVDRERGYDVLDRRQLIPLAEQAQTQRVPDLPDDLLVRREAGAAVEVELNHCASKLSQ